MQAVTMVTNYIKTPQIRKIIDANDNDCESKLESIRQLLDGSPESKSTGGGVRIVVPSVEGVGGGGAPSGNVNGYESLLKDLSGPERKFASDIIDLMRSNGSISWDSESFELIVNGKKVEFSDLRLLLAKTVTSMQISQPIGLCYFVSKLIELKTPINHFRSGDVLDIRRSLLKIAEEKLGKSTGDSGGEVQTVGDSGGGVDQVGNSVAEGGEGEQAANSEVESTVKENGGLGGNKRKREVEEEEEGEEEELEERENKRLRADDIREDFNLPDKIRGLRRSPRLSREIENRWQSIENGGSGGKGGKRGDGGKGGKKGRRR